LHGVNFLPSVAVPPIWRGLRTTTAVVRNPRHITPEQSRRCHYEARKLKQRKFSEYRLAPLAKIRE
jgi:hypothetical protein